MQSSSLDQFIGQNIGTYRVERLLGRGRVNAVYLAYHSVQNRPVALQASILPETFSFEARRRFLERFRKEAAKLAVLRHPHILPVYDYGEHAGYCYLVTPYMANGSLADLFQHHGRFHYADVLDILQQAVAGLAYAHGKRVFHGALKPANIVFNNQQQMLVAGFGLTQILQMRGIEQDRRPYAHLFSIAGTLLTPTEYIAPEIVVGQLADARTDVYSLGVILFELLSGQPPFTGTNPLDIAIQHVQRPVLSLSTYCPDIPLALAAVVNQALDRDPARRFQRVEDLLQAYAEVFKVLPEKNTRDTVHAAQSVEYRDIPRNLQLLSPIITEEVLTVSPPTQETDKPQVVPASLAKFSLPPLPEPSSVVAAKNPQDAVYDLWTLSSQDTSPRADARQNAKPTARRRKSNRFNPFEERKKPENQPVSRRMVVAMLALGGVAVAGTAITLDLAINHIGQHTQNNAANLAKNAALNFVNPANGRASVLVHLNNGNFVAYDRACTHVGVYVRYDPVKQLLVCPAHGALFDPAQDGAVRLGPATKPLPKVAVHINADGTITA